MNKETAGNEVLGFPPDQVWFQTIKTLDDDRYAGIEGDLSNLAEKSDEDMPAVMFDSNAVSMVSFKPVERLHFTCLTIGSRGDVQPYIALCKVSPFRTILILGASKGRSYRQNSLPRRISRMGRGSRHRIRPCRRRPGRTHENLRRTRNVHSLVP